MIIKNTLLATLMVASSLFAAADAYAQTLRYAEFGPNRGTRAQALNWMAEQIKSRSDGSLELEIHWGKALLGTKAVLKGVGDGVADMGSVIGFFTPKKLRGYNIGDLPVANADEWVGMRALYEFASTNKTVTDEFAKAGVVYVTNYTTGPIQLICSKPMGNLDDLKGTKLRGSGPYGKTFSDFGADVQRMSQGKVYQALDSGLVTCNQNYYYSMKAYKQYEVAGHVLELDWGQNMSFGIVMNKRTFAGLSDAHKAVVRSVGTDFIDYLAQLMIQGKEKDKAAMVSGIEGKSISVTRLSENERTTLQEAGSKYIDTWIAAADEDGKDGKAMMSSYQAAIDKFTEAKTSMGYPWGK